MEQVAELTVRETEVVVRRARTPDVRTIKLLVDTYAGAGHRLLEKATVTLYEDVQEFWVAELAGEVVGCGALHVLWEDLAEIRTVAVHPEARVWASATGSSRPSSTPPESWSCSASSA